MRVAVLSDIHGNASALDAVLREVAAETVDAMVVTGDVLSGPDPVGVLDRLLGGSRPVHWVKGNADQEVVDAWDGAYKASGDAYWDDVTRWVARRLTRTQRDWIAGWPRSIRLAIDGLGEVLFVHATPRSLTEVVLVDSPVARWLQVLEGTDADALVLGHTHMPFARLVHRRRVVNPGSVGMAYGASGACWALLGPGVTLRQTSYDPDAAAEMLSRADAPGTATFVRNYVTSQPSDAEALTAFRPRSGVGPGER